MTPRYFWREPIHKGGQVIAGPFASPAEAGQWRRDHPPLQGLRGGPILMRAEDGVRVLPTAEDLSRCFAAYLPGEMDRDVA